jgi:hypothetical protein
VNLFAQEMSVTLTTQIIIELDRFARCTGGFWISPEFQSVIGFGFGFNRAILGRAKGEESLPMKIWLKIPSKIEF